MRCDLRIELKIIKAKIQSRINTRVTMGKRKLVAETPEKGCCAWKLVDKWKLA